MFCYFNWMNLWEIIYRQLFSTSYGSCIWNTLVKIYFSGSSLKHCHWFGSLIQLRVDLILFFLLSQLCRQPQSEHRYARFFVFSSIILHITDMVLHWLDLFCYNVTMTWYYSLFTHHLCTYLMRYVIHRHPFYQILPTAPAFILLRSVAACF